MTNSIKFGWCEVRMMFAPFADPSMSQQALAPEIRSGDRTPHR